MKPKDTFHKYGDELVKMRNALEKFKAKKRLKLK